MGKRGSGRPIRIPRANLTIKRLLYGATLAVSLCLLAFQPAYGANVVVNAYNFVSTAQSNRAITFTLLGTNSQSIAPGPWIIVGDSVTQYTGTNGQTTFSNMLTLGNYRMDIYGNPPRSFPFSLSITSGTWNVNQLFGTNVQPEMFYDTAQIDALLSSLGGGGSNVPAGATIGAANGYNLTNLNAASITGGPLTNSIFTGGNVGIVSPGALAVGGSTALSGGLQVYANSPVLDIATFLTTNSVAIAGLNSNGAFYGSGAQLTAVNAANSTNWAGLPTNGATSGQTPTMQLSGGVTWQAAAGAASGTNIQVVAGSVNLSNNIAIPGGYLVTTGAYGFAGEGNMYFGYPLNLLATGLGVSDFYHYFNGPGITFLGFDSCFRLVDWTGTNDYLIGGPSQVDSTGGSEQLVNPILSVPLHPNASVEAFRAAPGSHYGVGENVKLNLAGGSAAGLADMIQPPAAIAARMKRNLLRVQNFEGATNAQTLSLFTNVINSAVTNNLLALITNNVDFLYYFDNPAWNSNRDQNFNLNWDTNWFGQTNTLAWAANFAHTNGCKIGGCVNWQPYPSPNPSLYYVCGSPSSGAPWLNSAPVGGLSAVSKVVVAEGPDFVPLDATYMLSNQLDFVRIADISFVALNYGPMQQAVNLWGDRTESNPTNEFPSFFLTGRMPPMLELMCGNPSVAAGPLSGGIPFNMLGRINTWDFDNFAVNTNVWGTNNTVEVMNDLRMKQPYLAATTMKGCIPTWQQVGFLSSNDLRSIITITAMSPETLYVDSGVVTNNTYYPILLQSSNVWAGFGDITYLGHPVQTNGPVTTWARQMSDGSWLIGLVDECTSGNTAGGGGVSNITVNLNFTGQYSQQWNVSDLWTNGGLQVFTNVSSFTYSIAAQTADLFRAYPIGANYAGGVMSNINLFNGGSTNQAITNASFYGSTLAAGTNIIETTLSPDTSALRFANSVGISDPSTRQDLISFVTCLQAGGVFSNLVDACLFNPRFNPQSNLTWFGRSIQNTGQCYSAWGAYFPTNYSILVNGLPDVRSNNAMVVVWRMSATNNGYNPGLMTSKSIASLIAPGGTALQGLTYGNVGNLIYRSAETNHSASGDNIGPCFEGHGYSYAVTENQLDARHVTICGATNLNNFYSYFDGSFCLWNGNSAFSEVFPGVSNALTTVQIGYSGDTWGGYLQNGEVAAVLIFSNNPQSALYITTNQAVGIQKGARCLEPDTVDNIWLGDSLYAELRKPQLSESNLHQSHQLQRGDVVSTFSGALE